jgi:beta-fructofuranosidase
MNRRRFILSSAAVALGTPSSLAIGKTLQSAAAATGQELRDRLMHDPLRPQYHLLPQAGFVGDPCAPRFFAGQYHVFYHGSYGGGGWHHAISHDLVHWSHLPIALTRTPDSFDAYGTFTGSVLPGGEGASIVYTGVTKVPTEQETIRNEGLREVQCIATSTDADLKTWRKLDHPIIDGPPAGLKVVGFRDPFSWKEDDTWFIGVGSGFSQIGGAVLLYRSKDARHWEYLHPLAQGTWNGEASSNPVPSGEMWECPDFFALGDKHVLLYSTAHTTYWEVGDFDKRELRFHSQRKGRLDHGAFYAPKSMLDGKMRRILWGWVQETRPREAIDAGWSGCVSLPRVLTLGPDGELEMQVASEFDFLLTNTIAIQQPHDSRELNDALARAVIRGRAGEIRCTFKVGESSCGLDLRIGSKTENVPFLRIAYDGANDQPTLAVDDKVVPLSPDRDGHSSLHIWIDGSVVEIFVDKRRAITSRLYAAPLNPAEINIAWTGAVDSLKSLVVSEVKPISDDRLTS